VRIPDRHFSRVSILLALLIGVVAAGIMATPSGSRAQNAASSGTASLGILVHGVSAVPAAALRFAARQDAGQAAAPPAASAPKPVVLPDGDGKAIAEQYCQACHRLTNLTKAHKSADDWKDTIQTMIDRGADIPPDKVDVLVPYLVKNFGPKDASAPAGAPPASDAAAAPAPTATTPSPAATAATPAPATPSSSTDAAPTTAAAAPAAPKPVELPDGDGKAIAIEDCQACHRLTNIVKAHKNLDEWKDTVQTMIDRGADVPADKIDILVQYLAKNFGPNGSSQPATPSMPVN